MQRRDVTVYQTNRQSPALGIKMRRLLVVRKSNFLWYALILSVSILVYISSQSLLAHYINGDQIFYINFYHSLKQAPFSAVTELQLINTGSAEPLYGYISWIFVNLGFEKNTYIALSNVLLTMAVGLAMKNSGANPIIFLFVVTNFYFVVLLTSAERLKFGYLFFALLFAFPGKISIVSGLLTPLFHFQMFINYASLFLGRFAEMRVKDFKKLSTLVPFVALTIVAAFGVYYIMEHYGASITFKVEHYSAVNTFKISDFVRLLGLIALALVLSIRFGTLLAYMAPIAISVALLGPERVNMIGFVTLLFIAAKNKQLMNPFFILLLSYFSFKTIDYIKNIYAYGNGFVI
ncbi:hypothetical protein LGT41_0010495 [Abyssibius alkaniclasticus]|uniref:hypothetical protein n=1 Tax=Abyssibius alkaniclasticus TaxID=2881234 RepID=UPI0023631B02|nr:hypothetical protein [Abyssibius alkaniclasticus]UPH70235.1 hypothetical protein LGT41_0010495 [Abyssibius alkaniclasticus]